MEALVKKRRELDAMEAEWLADLGEYVEGGEWALDGYATPAAALRHGCRMDHGTARQHVELARKLRDLPVAAEAFGNGDMSRQHAMVLANACTPERLDAFRDVEAELVDVARAHTPKELAGVVRYLADAIDGDGGAAADERKRARRRLHLSRTLDGMLVVDGFGDPESARIHETAIRAEMQRDFRKGDGRTTSQRRWDALTNILRRALDTGSLGECHGVRPHLTVVSDLYELPGSTPELVEIARAERRSQGMLSQATLERIMCDCDVTRVLMAGPSEVLDVGRAQRTVTPAQWKALIARDKGCVVCGAPPEHCEAHHRRPWHHGGPTDLDNLELRCDHDHRQAHREQWETRTARSP